MSSTSIHRFDNAELMKLDYAERSRRFWRPEWIPSDVANESAQHLIHDHEAVQTDQYFVVRQRRFVVKPGVFNPNFFWGNEITCAVLMERTPSVGHFFEIGCGSGYVAVTLALEKPGLRVSTGDISAIATANTAENASAHGLQGKLTVAQSNIFDAFKGKNLKFDYVYWNYPYGHTTRNYSDLTDIMKGLWDPYFAHLHKLFEDADEMVAEKGRILLTFSNEVGFIDAFEGIAALYGWALKEVASSTPDNYDMRHRYMEASREEVPCETVGVTNGFN